MLTDKAKEDFLIWFYYSKYSNIIESDIFDLEDYKCIYEYLIIEWLSTLKYKGVNFYFYFFNMQWSIKLEWMEVKQINLQVIDLCNRFYNKNYMPKNYNYVLCADVKNQ